MAEDDDDPYLAELLDISDAEEGKAFAQRGSIATAAGTSTAALLAANTTRNASNSPSPSTGKSNVTYQASDTHRETLKLLSQLSPAGAKAPSAVDVQKAFRALYPPFQTNGANEGVKSNAKSSTSMVATIEKRECPCVAQLDVIQEELEVHLDTVDLFDLRDVIKEEIDAWQAGKRKALAEMAGYGKSEKATCEEAEQFTGDLDRKGGTSKGSEKHVGEDVEEPEGPVFQASLLDGGAQASQASQDTANGELKSGDVLKKRKRGSLAGGGRATLPLMVLKSARGGGGASRSVLIELDERDKAQDLTGDSGAVGRVHVKKDRGVVLDLKGHQYLAELCRCPTMLLVSLGEEEAKVEDVVDTLCVLTHHHDELEAMGGKVLRRGEEEEESVGGEESDYGLMGSEGEGARAGKRMKAMKRTVSKRGSTGVGVRQAKRKSQGAARKGGASSAGAPKRTGMHAKKQGPKRVSLRALKRPKPRKGSDVDEEEEEKSFSDDDDDSDFSV